MTLPPPQGPIRIVERHPWRRRGAKDAALERVGAAAEPPLAASPLARPIIPPGGNPLLATFLGAVGAQTILCTPPGCGGANRIVSAPTGARGDTETVGQQDSLLGSTTTGVSQLARLGPNFGVRRPPGYGSKAEKQTNRLLQSGGNFI
jgi:hypothetical protein